MWYHTKELYMASQIGCYFPKAMPEAAEFSEELYQQVFEAVVAERVALRESIYSMSVEHGLDIPPCDAAEERRYVEKFMRDKLELMQLCIPEEILAKVADRRMLALDAATPELCAMIKVRKEEVRREWDIRNDEYCAWLAWLKDRHPKSFLNELYLHDVKINGVQRKGRDLEISFDSKRIGSGTNIAKAIFVNCEILAMDEGFENSTWKYVEIYEIDSGFEIHVLSADWSKNALYDLVVKTDNVRYEYNKRA